MIARSTRIVLSALALAAAFTLGMLYAQHKPISPAVAQGKSPVIAAFPMNTIQSTMGDKVTTSIESILLVHADGQVESKSSNHSSQSW